MAPGMTQLVTLEREAEAEYTEKKSVFIGRACPISSEEEALSFIARVKKAHGGARHNVFAYLLDNGACARCSDDGEPQGTGGVPVLDVIRKNRFSDAAIVVTRYFGGILLGAGGLVRAYSAAARMAVEEAHIVVLEPITDFALTCRYDEYPKLKNEFLRLGVTETGSAFSDVVQLTLSVRSAELPSVTARLSEMSAGRLIPQFLRERRGNTVEM